MQLGSEPWIPDKQILEICHCRSETILLTPNPSCEDCSAFTRVAACTLARSPDFVTRYPKASDISSPPCLLRLLPAGAVAGWDLHPLESAAFARHTPKADVRQRPWIYDFTPWGRCDNRRPRRSMTQSARPAASAILLRSSLPRFLFKNPLHHAGADTQLSADLEDAITVSPQLQYFRLHRGPNSTAAQLCAVRPGASKTRVYSFANDPTLELGKHAKHLKHRFARSRRSIESLLVEEQTRPPCHEALPASSWQWSLATGQCPWCGVERTLSDCIALLARSVRAA